MAKILVVEDELKILDLIAKYLTLERHECLRATSGVSALEIFHSQKPDLIILDIMLPDLDGLEVCKEIRRKSTVPIIMLTARIDEIDRLLGFENGADDYVCKPFIPRELTARIKAVLRRARPDESKPLRLSHGPFEVDLDRHVATLNGIDTPLTLIEFTLLTALMKQPGKTFSRQDLLTIAHGHQSGKDLRTIDSHIKNLRKKIDLIAPESRCIESVYGVGYRLN